MECIHQVKSNILKEAARKFNRPGTSTGVRAEWSVAQKPGEEEMKTSPDNIKAVSVCAFLQSIAELEAEMLNGQKLQGPQTSAEVYKLLQKRDMVNKWVHFLLWEWHC